MTRYSNPTGRAGEREPSAPSTDGDQPNPTGKRQLQERLDLPDAVVQAAVDLYESLPEPETAQYADTLPIAVLYITVRQHGIPRRIDEMAEVAAVSPPKLYRTARFVSDTIDEGIPPAEPEMYVTRLVDEFGITAESEQDALEMLAAAKRADYHVGRNPAGMAASALYAVTARRDDGSTVTQRTLSEKAGVRKKTIRRHYRQMCKLASTTPDDVSGPEVR